MSEIKQYDTEVRLEALMGTKHYGVHIHAMTAEDLHSKSDIAVELAWRDLRIEQLVGENAALTDKAASELSNSWLLHRAVMTIQAALHCIHGTNIYEAQCWLESIADDAELVIPPEMMLSDLQRWFDENMTGLITHSEAVEIIKAEMSTTTQAINEIKAQGIEEYGNLTINIGQDENCEEVIYAGKQALLFAASLRGEHEIKS